MLRLSGDNEIGKLAKKAGITAVALTDSNNIHAAIRHRASCVENGVKPILGCHANFGRGWHKVVHPQAESYDFSEKFTATLLCENATGFQSLSKLLSIAQLNSHGFIDADNLSTDATKGLFFLPGYNSDVAHCLQAGLHEDAHSLLAHWAEIFPHEHLLCQLSLGGRQYETELSTHLAKLAYEVGIPSVAAHPILFASQEDFEHHEIRSCIAESWLQDDEKRPHPYSEDQYFLSATELKEKYATYAGAVENAEELAQRCNYDFGLREKPNFPRFVDKEQQVVKDTAALLHQQAHAGLAKIFATKKEVPKEYLQRLDEELAVIEGKGFADYFLIVAEFVDFAKAKDIPVGPGRGSGAGSLVAYALGITGVDPIYYDLLFERFLNPERTALPDFDIDFCKERRGEIFAHAREVYGKHSVSQVVTFGSLKAKAVIRDVCRVLGIAYMAGDELVRLIPDELNITLAEARKKSEALDKMINRDERFQEVWTHALALEGLPRQAGTHAAAIIIAPQEITHYCPILLVGDNSEPVCQYSKDDAEAVGLIKFDFLGLKNLTMLQKAQALIRQTKKNHADFDFRQLPLNDKGSYALYCHGNTTGLFQSESAGMAALMKQLQPQSIEDIAVTISLFRPGVLSSNLHQEYLDRRHGKTEVIFVHPKAQAVLEPTFGIMIYQEQVMRMAQVMADFSLAKADQLRAAMGKKNVHAMAALGEEFTHNCAKLIGDKNAGNLFKEIKEFAGYGFNKSHAIAYAAVSYQTAYCKANFLAIFYVAALSTWFDDTKNMTQLLDDAKANGITIRLPCINESDVEFTLVNQHSIRFGLCAIRGIGKSVAQKIVDIRKEVGGKFTSLEQLCEKFPLELLNKRLLEGLINSGACDCLFTDIKPHLDRPLLLAKCAQLREHASFVQQHTNQDNLFASDETTNGSNQLTTQLSKNLGYRQAYREAELILRAGDGVKKKKKRSLHIEQLLAEETLLGTAISANFLHTYQWLLPRELPKLKDGPRDGMQLWAGHVASIVVNHLNRSSKRIVFRLSDGVASFEVNATEKNTHGLAQIDFKARGLVVLVKGDFENNYNGTAQLRATRIYDINAWCADNIDKVVIRQPDNPHEFAEILDLLANLQKLPDGTQKIEINVHEDNLAGTIDLGLSKNLSADDLIKLRDLCGKRAPLHVVWH